MQESATSSSTGTVPPNVVSAIFENRADAGDAVEALRNLGVGDHALSVVSRRDDETPASDTAGDDASTVHPGLAALDGAGVGAAVGALFGLVSVVIPGVGPFVTAGALGQVLGTAAGAAVSGAVVGGTSGALAGAIAHLGVSDEEATYYAGEVERGGTYLAVDLSQTALTREDVLGLLTRHGGRQRAG